MRKDILCNPSPTSNTGSPGVSSAGYEGISGRGRYMKRIDMTSTIGSRHTTMLCAVLLLTLTQCAFSVERHMDNGTLYVRNGPVPRDGIRTVELRELWRAGGEDEELFFGMVPRIESDRDGNIYILDAQLCHIHVFSPDGTLLRTLFREGDGPGEIRGPRDMLLMGDGTAGMVLETGGAVAFVKSNGDPAGSFSLSGSQGGIYSLVSGSGSDSILVLAGTSISPGERPEIRLRHNFIGTFTRDGNPVATLASTDIERNLMNLLIDEREDMPPFLWCFDVGPEGDIYTITDRNRYTISIFRPDGSLKMVIEREYEPFPRSEEDCASFSGMLETANENLPIEVTVEIERNHAAVAYLQRGITVLDDGSLWVLTERGARSETAGIMAAFDVFDCEGEYINRIELYAPHDGSRVGIIPVSSDRFVVIKGYLESLASQFGNGATFDEADGAWEHPEVIVYQTGEAR